jgi:acyl transferase domain-containing protein/acyl carrier protein/ubiquinone/menaquinone biosynthesis C-methylase UbiE
MQGKKVTQHLSKAGRGRDLPDFNEDIAIIGMACRFPGAKNHEEYWENLRQGRTEIRIIPEERWDWKAYWGDPQTGINKTNSKWGGFIEDVASFDPDFFGLSAREVESMDPQQRIALELSWSCFEDAGIRPSQVSGENVGVFIGVANFDYKELQEKECYPIEAHYALGVAASVITSRISYFYNLKGPSFPLDTACSSSLYAIHAAVQAIHQGECDMALAGGVSLLLTPLRYISFAKMGVLSPTGSCKTFDADADGIVRGEGAGLILLKPLARALADGDLIYGILKGSAINHSGKTSTISYPNPEQQTEVIVRAFQRARVTPESISYIEAHGTGTPKGDPIEFEGLVNAFQCYASTASNQRPAYCGLGSVKPNIGHLESAAGIAAVIKVLLAMNYRQLPGNQNFKRLNPRIAIQNSPFYIIDHLQAWQPPQDENQQAYPRRAGVSAFGFSGTNAHIILEEAPPCLQQPQPQLPAYFIGLSAKTEPALRQKIQELARWIAKDNPDGNLPDISATLIYGREHFPVRAAFLATTTEELREKLQICLENGQVAGYFSGRNPGKKDTFIHQLELLAKNYIQGTDPDWAACFPDMFGRRISLPTYPFAREHYWVPEHNQTMELSPTPEPTAAFARPAGGGSQTTAGDVHQTLGNAAEINQWFATLLFGRMSKLGLFQSRVHSIGGSGLRETLGIIPKYDRWFKESLNILEDYGFAKWKDGWFQIQEHAAGLDGENLWHDWEAHKEIYVNDPDQRARVLLTDTCLRNLPEILTGSIPATDVLFPDSSMALVACIYKDNSTAGFFTAQLANSTCEYVKRRIQADSKAKVRIIEVGAGTGSTSESVFARLKPYSGHIEYCYTDISKAFLLLAEEKYGPENPYLNFQLWNIEKSAAEQGIDPESYDIAIAANVLHATQNIRRTLRNLKAVLKPGGILLADELTQKSIFTTLTFGLLDGWWRYDDEELRIPGSPLLSRKSWQKVLNEEGFSRIVFPAESKHHLGQQVICAEMEAAAVRLPEPMNDQQLREKSTEYFKKLIGGVLRIPYYKIDATEPLERYGIDSILISQLNGELRKTFANIGNTSFDEYPTIDSLVEHFIQTRRESMIQLAGSPVRPPDGFPAESCQMAVPELASTAESPTQKPARFIHFRDMSISSPEPDLIAIIGMSGRFPQARNLAEYWENLRTGKNCITEIPGERWPLQGFYHPDRREAIIQNKSYSQWGAFLDDNYQFDPLFFNISPREAETIDPQELLFLEECWKALEDAGYAPSKLSMELRQRTGVFGGITEPGSHMTWFASMVNRVSYFLNLQGPSIAVDTMCSSSLTAIHQACEYLRQGRGNLAIAGGVNLYSNPAAYVKRSALQIISDTSWGTAFQKGGIGFVPGEGVGVVILKAYQQALQDGDHIYALIRGTAVNHKGKTNGFMAPGLNQLAAVIEQALAQNHTDPRTITYIESAASGSEIMDEIEMAALKKVFANRTQASGVYKTGSVKSNIGHCESASGMAQLLKVILSLNNRTLVPTLISGELNPNINFEQLPYQLQREVSEWEPVVVDGIQVPRRAGITNVGLGGVNAHIIVEEFGREPGAENSDSAKPSPVLFVLSARTKERLIEYTRLWVQYLQQSPDIDLKNIAYTLQIGREEMVCRLAVVANCRTELLEKLNQWIESPENMDICHFGDLNTTKIIFQEVAGQIIKTGNLREIAKLWVLGNPIPWQDLYQGMKPHRVGQLPVYPFERAFCRSILGPNQKPASNGQNSNRSLPLESGTRLPGKERQSPRQNGPYLEKTITEIMRMELGLKEINGTDNLCELGMNSLIFVKVVNAIEKTYNIEFDFEKLYPKYFETLQSMIQYVKGKIG